MPLDTKICPKCKGEGKIPQSKRTIHSLPENECADTMNSDRDLYNLTVSYETCPTCNGKKYVPN